MIWFQLTLVVCVLLLTYYLIKTRRKAQTKAYKKLLLLIFLFVSILTIIYPESLTAVAHIFGIGRGADLLLYVVALAVLFQLVNNYIKEREELVEIHKLARKVTILEANLKYKIKP